MSYQYNRRGLFVQVSVFSYKCKELYDMGVIPNGQSVKKYIFRSFQSLSWNDAFCETKIYLNTLALSLVLCKSNDMCQWVKYDFKCMYALLGHFYFIIVRILYTSCVQSHMHRCLSPYLGYSFNLPSSENYELPSNDTMFKKNAPVFLVKIDGCKSSDYMWLLI